MSKYNPEACSRLPAPVTFGHLLVCGNIFHRSQSNGAHCHCQLFPLWAIQIWWSEWVMVAASPVMAVDLHFPTMARSA
jgi:hypothetical protein